MNTTTLNEPNVRKWIAALRSGRYPQTQGQLRAPWNTEAAFCCLGVACDLFDPTLWDNTYYLDTGKGPGYEEISLPPRVSDWLGLPRVTGHEVVSFSALFPNQLVQLPPSENALVHMNDERKFSFAQIADYLEGALARQATS